MFQQNLFLKHEQIDLSKNPDSKDYYVQVFWDYENCFLGIQDSKKHMKQAVPNGIVSNFVNILKKQIEDACKPAEIVCLFFLVNHYFCLLVLERAKNFDVCTTKTPS